MKKLTLKPLVSSLLASTMLLACLTGCGGGGDTGGTTAPTGGGSTPSTGGDGGSGGDARTVVIHLNGMDEEQKMIKAMEEIQTLEKYQDVTFEFHGRDADFYTKIPVEIAGGSQIDIMIAANPMKQQQFADEGMILPLDDLIANAGLDYEEEFGQYHLNAMNNGKYYTIPHNITKWAITYNKALFDAAGEPYPDSRVPMTWDEYAEVAKRVTQGTGAEKKYGAFYLTWGTYTYGDAIMALGGGENFYNAEGTSNIEDPAFARSLERIYNMMHTDGSTPTHANVVTSKTGPTDMLNGNYAMGIGGAYNVSWALDKEGNPRDWQVGVAPMPVDSGSTPKTWGIVNGFCIPITTADADFAFEVGLDLVRISAKYSDVTESATRTVDQSELFVEAAEILAEEGVTKEDLEFCFANDDTIFVGEKIMGANNVAYEAVYMEEVEKYLVQEQDLATTIANIKERGDKAIAG